MKLIVRLLLSLTLVAIVGSVFLIFLMLQDEPLLEPAAEISVEDVRRARAFMRKSDPRRLPAGTVTAFTISDTDLELLMNYGFSRFRGGAVEIDLNDDRAFAVMSARLMDNPLGNYLNVQLGLSQQGNVLAVHELQIGGLALPGQVADFIAQSLHRLLKRMPEYTASLEAINGFSISPDQVNVVYQWQPDLVDQISERGRNLLVSQEEQERILAHARNLSSITRSGSLSRITSVTSVLSPMIQFAQARGGNPVDENRTAILVTAMYIMGISVPRVLGLPANTIPRPGRHRLTLAERHDFAQHFLVSAALTVGAGSSLADTIGLLKELDDSQGGSGFSFTDIGADRSGVRFAELAADPATAAALQRLMVEQPTEDLFMAEFRDLPESMAESDFVARYGGVGEPAYNTIMADIESRIAAMRLFSELD
ncbi:MAG: hypothetical protein KJN90_04870 [Gammaproteobacteria bacterium]|nr:hypothetical protein [Gammaproteobacteria bacterium]